MLDAHILVQARLDQCEALHRANNGDELALSRTHQDANGRLPRLLALIHGRLMAAVHAHQAVRMPPLGALLAPAPTFSDL